MPSFHKKVNSCEPGPGTRPRLRQLGNEPLGRAFVVNVSSKCLLGQSIAIMHRRISTIHCLLLKGTNGGNEMSSLHVQFIWPFPLLGGGTREKAMHRSMGATLDLVACRCFESRKPETPCNATPCLELRDNVIFIIQLKYVFRSEEYVTRVMVPQHVSKLANSLGKHQP